MTHSNQLVTVGVIGAPHGVKGAVNITTELQDIHALKKFSALQLEDGRILKVTSVRPRKPQQVTVEFEGITTREAVELLKLKKLYVPRNALPKIKHKDHFYHADLVGLTAFSEKNEKLGSVIAVHNFGAGDILEIQSDNNASFMVPFSKDFVPLIDEEAQKLVIAEGALS